jgi:chaperone modulatory protein CbpM
MINVQEFLTIVRVDAESLEAWIEAGWLMPRRDASGWAFSEMDLARARLIFDLKQDFGLNDEGVAVTLDLLDQIYGLRRALRDVLSGVSAQPEATRRRIVDDVRKRAASDRYADASSAPSYRDWFGGDEP